MDREVRLNQIKEELKKELGREPILGEILTRIRQKGESAKTTEDTQGEGTSVRESP